jgi:NAD(P)-dependent dehydrogenase (short-subunit alcohol dehydrogenase family)
VNVLGTRRLIEAAAPVLIANGKDAHSRIVAVASAAGHTGLYHLASYSAAKHAVVGLIRGVAMDLAPYGVTANSVSPGSTRTAILEASAKIYDLLSVEEFAQHQPIGRLLEPSEVAAAIVWLCSPLSSAVTGADVAVDGGMTVS